MARWEDEDEDWDRVRDQLRSTISAVARRQSLITYGALILDVPEISEPNSHALAEMLGEISFQCHADGLPLLSALVVYKDKNSPGPGFYEAAKKLGHSIGSNELVRIDFWSSQVKKCHEQWAQNH